MKFAQDIVLAPVITENSMAGIADKKYTFKVATDATKIDVAKAVEELFGVKVAKVNTISVRTGPLSPVVPNGGIPTACAGWDSRWLRARRPSSP